MFSYQILLIHKKDTRLRFSFSFCIINFEGYLDKYPNIQIFQII